MVDLGSRVLDSIFASKARRSCWVRRRAFLAWASCCAMKASGCSIEGVPNRDGRGELGGDILPKAAFPGGIWWGFAIRVSRRGEVGERFDPQAKRGKVLIVCEM